MCIQQIEQRRLTFSLGHSKIQRLKQTGEPEIEGE